MNIYINNDLSVGECFFSSPKYKPFIGISVGSKPPSLDKAINILKWALKSDSNIIPILIADEIAHINYKGLGYSTGKVINQVTNAKEKQLNVWESAIKHFSNNDKLKFKLTYWNEIVSPTFQLQQNIIREDFSKETELYEAIISLVEVFIKSNGKTVTHKRCVDMSEYVIQELPLLLFGMELENNKYQMMLYPTYYSSEMLNMIAKIRRKSIFSDLLTKLIAIEQTNFNKIIQMIVSDNDVNKHSLN
jgi:tRNA-dependent cyclodipeptide synthase